MMAVLVGAGPVLLFATVTTITVLRRQLVVIRVSGLSMAPTLRPSDRLLVRRTTGEMPRAGEVVVFSEPGPCRTDDPTGVRHSRWLVKRVVAVPGDPAPPSLPASTRPPGGVVPPDHLVIVGDNLEWSHDSRHFGPIRADRILGVVVRRLGGATPSPSTPGLAHHGAEGDARQHNNAGNG
jgi:signal peptidase I